ncbi:hypothetical protein MMC13_006189 [Lambiella insularis]|nr:hypothetical protein [Lambiella insularis]
MAHFEKVPQWILQHGAQLNLTSRPVLRMAATAMVALVLLMTCNLFFASSKASTFSDRIEYALPLSTHPVRPAPEYDYTPPKDLHLPRPPGNGIASESRIGKISILFNGKDPTLVRALQSHEAHNRKWGYPLLILRHGLLDGGNLDGIWNKPAYILAALLEEMRKPERDRLQWLFWHDADTVLLNPLIPLSLFVPPSTHSHIHILLTADPHGLNNGVFFLRVHPWSISLLTAVLAFPTYNPTTALEYRDQSALALVLNTTSYYRKHHLLVPQRWFNAYAGELEDAWMHNFQVRRGDLLVHFAGVREREPVMEPWLKRAEGRAEVGQWEVEVQRTSLEGEVQKFWKQEEEKLAKEKEAADGVGQDATGLLGKVEGWVTEYKGKVAVEEEEKVKGATGTLKEAVEEKEDAETLQELMAEVVKVGVAAASAYRVLVELNKRALHRDAHAAIVDAERLVLDINMTKKPELAQMLQSMLEKLRELLARDPDNVAVIKTCTEDLRKETKEFAVKVKMN